MTVVRDDGDLPDIDTLERVLDKGIVIEVHTRSSDGVVDLKTNQSHFVVAATVKNGSLTGAQKIASHND